MLCKSMCAHVTIPAELCAERFLAIFVGLSTLIQQSGKKSVAISGVIVRFSICERLKKPGGGCMVKWVRKGGVGWVGGGHPNDTIA